ncbi:hypothetical protein [Microbacterium panaciterrae]|uniref:Uncharacterized protein n=1 Tax=Microbacterium panaciterrae TaxID=985759 RepID=A0ABP8P9D9_9MICO
MNDEPAPSLRTAEEPMTFRRSELIRGGFWTWVTFVALMEALLAVGVVIGASTAAGPHGSSAAQDGGAFGAAWQSSISLGLYGMFLAALIGGTVSGLVALVATPLAGVLGRRLRHVRATAIHVAAYAILGAVVGTAISLAIGSLSSGTASALLAGIAAPLTAVAAATGWWITAHQALREDARVAAAWPDPV